MRRRTLRNVAKILLVVWTMGVSFAVAQVCWGTFTPHYGGGVLSAIPAATAWEHANPVDPEEDCPPAPDANVDSGNSDWAVDVLAAVASAPGLRIQPYVDTLAVCAEQFRGVTPASIPAYLVAHRLRF